MARPQCCSNPPTLDPTSGEGTVDLVAGLKTYISGSPHSKFAILLVTDIYGYEAPNARLVADKVAAAGYYVAVPDFFYGDPYKDEDNIPFEDWLKKHGPDKGFQDAKLVVEALKSKGFSAIGAAGFCWGGKVVTELSKSKLFIEAAVLLHPSLLTVDDIKKVSVPIEILAAGNDDTTPPALVKQFEEVLSTKPEVDSYVEIFPNVEHGWTIRYNLDDEAAVKAANKAHKKMLGWFSKYLRVPWTQRIILYSLLCFILLFCIVLSNVWF